VATSAPAGLTALASPTPSGAVQITLALASPAQVDITVRNLAGRQLALLSPGEMAAGTHTVLWDGKSSAGTRLPTGTYLLLVRARTASGATVSAITSVRR
jgi:flagellar hook assembly protein FlgD